MAACFDIGGSFMRYGRSDAAGQVAEFGRVNTPVESFAEFVAAIRRAKAALGDGIVSISLAGVYDSDSGMATVANVPCLNGIRVEHELEIALGVPVRVTNDADCFTLAEAHSGVARGKRNVFGIILGTGVGGGVVLNGTLLRGFGGISGEWGHGPVTDPAAGGLVPAMPRLRCACGKMDCLEASGSARGLERIHHTLTGENLASAEITARWNSGDAACVATIDVFVEQIARPLSVIVNTLGCDCVPVGGGLGSETALIGRIDTRVRAFVLAHYPVPLVVAGQHGPDAGLIGAAVVAMREHA